MIYKLRTVSPNVWLIAFILFGFAIRLGTIDTQSLWRDEVDSIRFGENFAAQFYKALDGAGLSGLLSEIRESLTRPGFNGPLYFLALNPWARLAGVSAYALRFFSTFFGILTIPLIYALSKRLFKAAIHADTPRHLSLLVAWLATISPYFVWYSQEVKMYTLITTLSLTAIYALRRAVDASNNERTWHWWLLLIIATTLAMYSHILAALLIGVEVVLFVLWWSNAKRHISGAALALAALTLPYLPLATWQLRLALTPGDQGHAFYRFDEMLRILGTSFANGVLPFDQNLATAGVHLDASVNASVLNPALWGMGILSALFVSGTLLWRDAHDRTERIGLAAWALLPIVVIALISLNRPIFTDRYLIWIGPAVYLLVALGILDLWAWKKFLGVFALIVVTLIALISINAQALTPLKPDFRSATRYIEERYQRDEVILFQIPYGQYTFDYYFEPPFRSGEGPYTNHRNADGSYLRDVDSFNTEITQMLNDEHSIWLVATEVDMWDERHLLEDWLNANGRVIDQAEFVHVTVTQYDLE